MTYGRQEQARGPLESAASLAVVQWVANSGKRTRVYHFRITSHRPSRNAGPVSTRKGAGALPRAFSTLTVLVEPLTGWPGTPARTFEEICRFGPVSAAVTAPLSWTRSSLRWPAP